jgi:hypothetical protein
MTIICIFLMMVMLHECAILQLLDQIKPMTPTALTIKIVGAQ